MRTWRVGTVSMGATLIMLGVFLLVSKWFGFEMIHIMASWWPVILIVLGAEILIFLLKSKEDKPFLKYDFLSIIFVGVLGTVGIGFAVLQSTGLMERAEQLIFQESHQFDLPELNYALDEEVTRVVVDTGNYPLTVEGVTNRDIAMFGTYEVRSHKKEPLAIEPEDYVSVKKNGDTVYVQVKGTPASRDQFSGRAAIAATILVPQHVKLEVNGNYNEITIKPRMLKSNWLIDGASFVSVQLLEKSNVLLTATDADTINDTDGNWNIVSAKGATEQVEAEDEDRNEEQHDPSHKQVATYQVGKGSNHLEVFRADNVTVTKVK